MLKNNEATGPEQTGDDSNTHDSIYFDPTAGPIGTSTPVVKPRRFRRCPDCRVVLAASKFDAIGKHRPGYGARQRARRCPECRRTGPTSIFKVVRDARVTA